MFQHRPVLLAEAIEWLAPEAGGVYVDGTLGGGGHSEAILKRGGEVYGIDRDSDAIAAAQARLAGYPYFHAVQGNFHQMKPLLMEQGVTRVQGVLLDLGVSSHQLDTAERGFSYHMDAPLDMRMDQRQALSAMDIVGSWDAPELEQILRLYGEEPWAARIAGMILEHRAMRPIKTTGDLVRVVDAAIPRKVRDRDKGHSAQRTFQALRIAVNDELSPLAQALEDAASMLAPQGRLCVITFHSLEDRIVKRTFRTMANPCTCPPKAPVCVCGKKAEAYLPVRGAVKPSPDEIAENPRSRSAQLRVLEKL